jgi:hypothetical protein
MLRRYSTLLIAFAIAGCASTSTSSSETATTPAPRRDTNVITADELAKSSASDLYAAIQSLRPSFLQTRGMTSPGIGTAPEVLNVYIDGIKAGDVSILHSLRAYDVKEVRKLSASDATQKYGTGHTMGAIVVTRK